MKKCEISVSFCSQWLCALKCKPLGLILYYFKISSSRLQLITFCSRIMQCWKRIAMFFSGFLNMVKYDQEITKHLVLGNNRLTQFDEMFLCSWTNNITCQICGCANFFQSIKNLDCQNSRSSPDRHHPETLLKQLYCDSLKNNESIEQMEDGILKLLISCYWPWFLTADWLKYQEKLKNLNDIHYVHKNLISCNPRHHDVLFEKHTEYTVIIQKGIASGQDFWRKFLHTGHQLHWMDCLTFVNVVHFWILQNIALRFLHIFQTDHDISLQQMINLTSESFQETWPSGFSPFVVWDFTWFHKPVIKILLV